MIFFGERAVTFRQKSHGSYVYSAPLYGKDVKVLTIKLGYELCNNINSKVLTFAVTHSAEIERNLISQRTKEALARKKSEGMRLGRPKGSQNKKVELLGKEQDIKQLLDKQVSVSAIARILNIN